MSLQVWSLIIIVASAVLMIVLEKMYPYTKGQKIFREGFFNDMILYTIVQSYLLGLIIFGFLNWIKSNTDLYRFSLLDGWPVWLQVVVLVIIHDFYIYWFHRWMHNNKVLWRLH
ncbi:MAG: sterol desaturase family protein, partial [Ignavibacteria bacterium]